MMYVPMLKTRAEEMRVAREMHTCFSSNMVPLFEIINELYKPSYKKDSQGEFVYEQRKTRKVKVKIEPTKEDIITLPTINSLVDGKLMFIDYFRFSIEKYGRYISFRKAELSFDLNNDLELYKNKLLEVTKYSNMIPVISLKPECSFPKPDLIRFVAELQKNTAHMALRITKDHPAIYISGRFKSHANTWFALVHELGHLLLHYHKNDVIVSFADNDNVKEQEANEFARNFFINSEHYKEFCNQRDICADTIKQFARQEGTIPEIVVARLQHDKKIGFEQFNHLL